MPDRSRKLPSPTAAHARIHAIVFFVLSLATLTPALAGGAETAELEEQLAQRRAALDETVERKGVLTSTLDHLQTRLNVLTSEVAELRNREALVEAELSELETKLTDAENDLDVARKRLRRATSALRERLILIYKSEEPNVMTFILDSEGFEAALGRAEYLSTLQESNDDVIEQVRELRDQVRGNVEAIRSSRDAIADREAKLESARAKLERREGEQRAATQRQRQLLSRMRARSEKLDDDVSELQDRIQRRLQAEVATGASVAGPPSGGVEAGSGQMIWPIDGTLTSPFGWRWGRMHEGLDIAAPEGVPIQAAADGKVVIAGPNGGYGNYTCIDHGGGLSSCYAHQSTIAVSPGQSVLQGEVIGEVGNTGASTGPHVHFETRAGGAAVDPLGYL